MNATLKSIGLLGILLFGILFSVTFVSPEVIENSAKGFVQYQIEKEIKEKYNLAQESNLANKALTIAEKLGVEKDKIKQDLENQLPEKIASILAAMCGYDCEKKKAIAASITTGYLERLTNIEIAEDTLGDIVKGKYLEVVGNLKTDLRIFFGSNFVMFLLLLSISFFKPQAVAHLFLPGMFLLLATIASSAIYIFGQDWFYTILYNDYMGFGYLVYIGIIFVVLMDIAFNKGKVSTEIINSILSSIGSALSVVPC